MPLLAASSQVDITVGADSTLTIQNPGGFARVEYPVGTSIRANGGASWSVDIPSGTCRLVTTTGNAFYEMTTDARSQVNLAPAEVAATQALVSEAGTLWANLPAPSAFRGLLYVSDVGINGSLWRSNGTIWSLVGGACVLGQSAVAVSCTASTAEEVLQSVNLPAGVMGINGALRLTTMWSCTGAVGIKTLRARLGTTALGGSAWVNLQRSAAATDYVNTLPQVLRNRNAANSQVTFAAANAGIQTSSLSAPSTFTEDTSVANIVAITGQKATAGEVLTLEAYTLELLR